MGKLRYPESLTALGAGSASLSPRTVARAAPGLSSMRAVVEDPIPSGFACDCGGLAAYIPKPYCSIVAPCCLGSPFWQPQGAGTLRSKVLQGNNLRASGPVLVGGMPGAPRLTVVVSPLTWTMPCFPALVPGVCRLSCATGLPEPGDREACDHSQAARAIELTTASPVGGAVRWCNASVTCGRAASSSACSESSGGCPPARRQGAVEDLARAGSVR